MGSQSMDNALSGVLTYRRALDVVSQNISNASNRDYSRQRAELKSNNPYISGGLSIGRGVQVADITRARDELLSTRLRAETQTLERYKQLESVYKEIENSLNEPSKNGMRGTLSSFNAAMQSLANQPENRGSRRSVVGAAATLANVMKRFHGSLQNIAGGAGTSSVDAQIQTTLEKINNIGEQIASLNMEINAAEAGDASPNDLLDKRNALAKEVSKYIDTNVQKGTKSYRVNVAGYTLVQQGEAHQLEYAAKEGEDKKRILYDDKLKSIVRPKNGQLKALMDLKEKDIPELIDRLNDMAVQFVDRFNDMHKAGFGLQGQDRNNFWSELPTQDNGIFRLEGMGALSGPQHKQRAGFIDSPDTVLTGDTSTDQPENFEDDFGVQGIEETTGNKVGNFTGTLKINDNSFQYDMSEDSIKDIINRINETDNKASAYLSAEDRLVIKGAQENDYQIDKLRDTGLLLEKANILTVGGTSRLAKEGVDDTATALIDGAGNLTGDSRIDALIKNPDSAAAGAPTRNLDLAEGTLQFESSNSDGFTIHYDAREESLQNVVDNINTAASNSSTNIAAEVTSDNRLRIFASNTPGTPGSGIDTEAKFSVNETASQQLVDETQAPMNDGSQNYESGDTLIGVKDASVFETDDKVIIQNNDGTDKETHTIASVNQDEDTVTLSGGGLTNSHNINNTAIRRRNNDNEKRNLLSALGMDRLYDSSEENYEYALKGEKKRPPIPDQVAGMKVDKRIMNNPDLIATAKGEDVDMDGIAETANGPGDGSNMYDLSNLHSEDIIDGDETSADEHISEMTAKIGNDASLVYREREAAESLVNQITDQVQSVSGVSLDEEMTKLVRYQQAFQASARVISTVRTMSNSVLRLL